MFKKLAASAVAAVMLTTGAFAAGGATGHVENVDFPFDGPFGSFDQNQLQRGLQIYTEICSACHGLKFVPLRTLGDNGGPHLPEDQVRAYAEQYIEVFDETLFDGEGDFRPGKPSDSFPSSNDPSAPDLSLMAKARAGFHGPYGLGINQFFKGIGGPEYIVALLTGYDDPPSCAPDDFDGNYNTAFASGGYPEECIDEDGERMYPGSWIGMSQPLYGEDLDFADGHPNSLQHEAEDVAAFLMWTAEPKLGARKQAGFVGVLFLTVLSVLLYLTNKRIWAPVKGRKND